MQPLDVSESESAMASSSLHVTTRTPQDTVNLASSESCFTPSELVHSQIPASAREPESSHVPNPFQYDLEEFFSLANNPSQSYAPPYQFLPPSSTTGRLSIGHNAELYQHWLPVDPNLNTPQPSIPPYLSNASSTFPGNSANDLDIYAEIVGSSHLTTRMTSGNDGTQTTLPFPAYDANNLHHNGFDWWSSRCFFLWSMSLSPRSLPFTGTTILNPMIFILSVPSSPSRNSTSCCQWQFTFFFFGGQRDTMFSV